MASLLQIFLLLASISVCSAKISRKGLRSKEENQVIVQSGGTVQSSRIDPSRVVQLSWQPRVFVYTDFITEDECDHLISLARRNMNSLVSNTQGARSLAGVELKDEVVARVEEKISAWTLLPLSNSRPIEIQNYANEDAKQKYDFYSNKSALQVSEPIMATVILCLSSASRGGEISFPDSQIKSSRLKSKLWAYTASHNDLLKPVIGNAILFFSVHPSASPDKSSHHERNPVIKGEMWSAVKIFHLRAVSEMKAPSEPESSDCTDEDESCPQWAALGECQRNPVFMIGSPDYYGTCRKSCKVC